MRHEDEAGRTVAALERAGVDEGLLYRRQSPISIKRLDRGDALAVDPDRKIETAGDRLVVDQHRAAAAKPPATAFARAKQIEALQQLDEVAMRLNVGRDRKVVERETDSGHRQSWSYAPVFIKTNR